MNHYYGIGSVSSFSPLIHGDSLCINLTLWLLNTVAPYPFATLYGIH